MITSTLPLGTLRSVLSLFAERYQGSSHRKQTLKYCLNGENIYTISRCRLNVATYNMNKWKVDHGKIEIISLVRFRSQVAVILNILVLVKIRSRPKCICGIFYLKCIGIDGIKKVTKL